MFRKIHRRVPAVVVLAVVRRCRPAPPASRRLRDHVERLLHFALGAHDADQVLHGLLQLVLDLIRILAGRAALEGLQRRSLRQLSICASSIAAAPFCLANSAANWPARFPNTSRSDSELPPSRFAPCRPAAASPAAKSPGTVDICESPSTRMPPIM